MILDDFPNTEQWYDYDCGPAALAGVLAFHGVSIPFEDLLALADPSSGTSPDVLIDAARSHGFDVEFGSYTPRQLRRRIGREEPAILALQAWGTGDDDGHYVVAIGYDAKGFYLEDPEQDELMYLPDADLLLRWHDMDRDGVTYERFAIVVGAGDRDA